MVREEGLHLFAHGREADYKFAATARLALNSNGALMGFHHKLDNAQAQPASISASGHSLVDLVKPFEDPFRFPGRQANSIVFNREEHVPVLRPRAQGNL